ncbi:MAG: hypothetical protein H7235_06795, partial [Bdellovibrionaceae bacterium]|nr:hypothetical protein [Pseudobdellovibrionaceae bacterium]
MPVIFLIFISFMASYARADSIFTPNLNARARAMGGTSIAYAHGADALFYNAAALARVEGYSLKIADANVGASKNSQRLIDQGFSSSVPLTSQNLQSLYGENYFAEGSAQSGMVFPFFGFGGYSSNYTTEIFNNPVFPTFNISFMSEYGYILAGALPVSENTSFGLTGRHMKRWSGKKDILVTDLIGTTDRNLIESNFQDKGTGDAIDVSFLTTLPPQNINIAVVWKDVGNTAFRTDTGNGPERQDDNLSLGVSKTAKYNYFDVTYAFEYDHIRQASENIGKKLHLGAEMSLGLIDLRAGLSQGNFTYGAGVDLW